MKENLTYEEAMSRLDEIIHLLETNQISLDESIELYQEGVELAHYCENKLKTIQERVVKIYENNQMSNYVGDNNE